MTKLGIHTHVPDPDKPDGTHAWVSVERGGRVTTYGLYGNSQASQQNEQGQGWNGSGTHIRQDLELGRPATSGRYRDLNGEQEERLTQCLKTIEVYSYRKNNCSHFASRTWEEVTGERLPIGHMAPDGVGGRFLAFTPAGLEQSIRARELVEPTALPDIALEPVRAPPDLAKTHAQRLTEISIRLQRQLARGSGAIRGERARANRDRGGRDDD